MLIEKFNLYNAEWLDLVFDHRNKEYGAYELRRQYGSTMTKAMGLTFAGLAVLIAVSFVFKHKPDPVGLRIINDIPIPRLIEPPVKAAPKKVDPPKSVEPVKPATPVQTTKYTTPVIVPNNPPVDPPIIAKIEGAIGPENVKGPAGGDNVIKPETGTGGNGPAPVDNVIRDANSGTLEVMPEPIGGAAAWSKFLQKNLRFPAIAQEQNVSGKVFMSFVIEKDGQLSNIKVERGAGYGFDEEATRVLKLAKAWKPGMQNGQPVRVKYVIPMNFQLADSN